MVTPRDKCTGHVRHTGLSAIFETDRSRTLDVIGHALARQNGRTGLRLVKG
jgi:hypothetical protein